MTFDDKYQTRPFEPASGSLERTAPSDNDPVEKSLLAFIQERAHRRPTEAETEAPHESDLSFEEISESTDHTIDRIAIRLGGNGF
jgi:hypothetical protein